MKLTAVTSRVFARRLPMLDLCVAERVVRARPTYQISPEQARVAVAAYAQKIGVADMRGALPVEESAGLWSPTDAPPQRALAKTRVASLLYHLGYVPACTGAHTSVINAWQMSGEACHSTITAFALKRAHAAERMQAWRVYEYGARSALLWGGIAACALTNSWWLGGLWSALHTVRRAREVAIEWEGALSLSEQLGFGALALFYDLLTSSSGAATYHRALFESAQRRLLQPSPPALWGLASESFLVHREEWESFGNFAYKGSYLHELCEDDLITRTTLGRAAIDPRQYCTIHYDALLTTADTDPTLTLLLRVEPAETQFTRRRRKRIAASASHESPFDPDPLSDGV